MSFVNIQNIAATNQADKDDSMFKKIFYRFLDELIRENYTYDRYSCTLSTSSLHFDDKKMFLTFLISPDEYQDYAQNETRLREAINEYDDYMQHLIDDRISDIWHEDMDEMGACLTRCADNGEMRYI